MKRRFEPPASSSQQALRDPHVPDQPRQLLTEQEAAAHCRYFDRGCAQPVRAFQQWARRAGVPVKRAGRARLYDARILDAFMEDAPWTRRHKASSAA